MQWLKNLVSRIFGRKNFPAEKNLSAKKKLKRHSKNELIRIILVHEKVLNRIATEYKITDIKKYLK